MKKSIVGLQKLMEIASISYEKAFLISISIPIEKLDYETLIKFQKSVDGDIRNLARELALKIDKEKLDYEVKEFLKKYFS